MSPGILGIWIFLEELILAKGDKIYVLYIEYYKNPICGLPLRKQKFHTNIFPPYLTIPKIRVIDIFFLCLYIQFVITSLIKENPMQC